MVNSDITVEYSIADEINYVRNGESKTRQMGDVEINEDGSIEAGLLGQTIIPNDPKTFFLQRMRMFKYIQMQI